MLLECVAFAAALSESLEVKTLGPSTMTSSVSALVMVRLWPLFLRRRFAAVARVTGADSGGGAPQEEAPSGGVASLVMTGGRARLR